MKEKNSNRKDYVILMLLGLIILYFRSAYTMVVPSLYGEDGTWTSLILDRGFLYALLHARGDYLVCGNIILLGISLLLNFIVSGENMSYYPQVVTIVQYLFFSFTALLPYICFQDILRKPLRILLWLSVLLVPLGNTGFEVFGKICNTGYLFYFIAYCLLAFRIIHRNAMHIVQIIAIDATLLLCCATHPGCYLLVGLAFLLDCFLQYQETKELGIKQTVQTALKRFSNKSWIVLGVLCSVLATYDLFVLTASRSVIDGSHITIEFCARSLLFSLVYPFYTNLSDTVIIGIFIGLFLVYCVTLSVGRKKEKTLLLGSIFVALLYFTITAIARGPELTVVLNNYTDTSPDRYYYALNICSLIPLIISIDILMKEGPAWRKTIGCVLGIYLLIVPGISFEYLFDFDKSGTESVHATSFEERIRTAVYNAPLDTFTISIDPYPWSIDLAPNYYLASLQHQRHVSFLRVANLTDSNWNYGIGTDGELKNRLLFTWESRDFLKLCDTLIAGNQQVKVLDVVDYGQWVHVVCDTTELDNFAYPSEIAFTLKGDIKQ